MKYVMAIVINNGGKIKIEHKSIWLASYFEKWRFSSKFIFLGGILVVLLLSMCICVSGNRIKNNNTAYSNDAKATRIKHIKNQQFIAFKPLLSGLCCIMLVITFIMHNTTVTRRPILPGKQFGGMRKLAQLKHTINVVGMNTCQICG